MLQIKNEKGGWAERKGENRKMIALVTASSCLVKLETVGQMQKKGGGGLHLHKYFIFSQSK